MLGAERADFVECALDLLFGRGTAECQKPFDRHRNGPIDVEPLRYITNTSRGRPDDYSAIGLLDPEDKPNQRCFSGSVGPDERYDLAKPDIQIDARDYIAIATAEPQTARGDQCIGRRRTFMLVIIRMNVTARQRPSIDNGRLQSSVHAVG